MSTEAGRLERKEPNLPKGFQRYWQVLLPPAQFSADAWQNMPEEFSDCFKHKNRFAPSRSGLFPKAGSK